MKKKGVDTNNTDSNNQTDDNKNAEPLNNDEEANTANGEIDEEVEDMAVSSSDAEEQEGSYTFFSYEQIFKIIYYIIII